jgi:hypothetical protein
MTELWKALSAFAVFLLLAVTATAQTPLGPEVIPADIHLDALDQFGATVACTDASLCALVWTSDNPDGHINNDQQWGRTLSPLGELSPRLLLRDRDGIEAGVNVLPHETGFVFLQDRRYSGLERPTLRLYDENLQPTTDFILRPLHVPSQYGDPDSYSSSGAVAAMPGGFVEVTDGFDLPGPLDNCFSCQDGLFLYFGDDQGRNLYDRIHVSEDPNSYEGFGLHIVAVDGLGNIIVVFSRPYTPLNPDDSGVFVRRFSSTGEPLGPEVQVNQDQSLPMGFPAVAASPDGEFLVVWQTAVLDLDNIGGVYARRFGADGEPLGPQFQVSRSTKLERNPQIVADGHGNYFLFWDSFDAGHGSDIRGRLYRHDGKPVADEMVINQDNHNGQEGITDHNGTSAAFAPNGTLLVSWQSDSPNQTNGEAMVPVVRRFAASPGQEICAIAGPNILCDLGRTGGPTELNLNRGGRPGEVTLFGDVDGDGRDDVCTWYKGLLRCDLSHEGSPDWRATLGFPGDVPLLADVNGDGKTDLCVRRRNLLLCDTAHTGQMDFRIVFGRGDETPLLGDLDGDGKADLCLVRAGVWDCRLSKSGELLHFRFGRGGDSLALGDADRDGRADPCFLHAGRLTCSTKHDGVGDYQLDLDVPGNSRLLFGNLDGL